MSATTRAAMCVCAAGLMAATGTAASGTAASHAVSLAGVAIAQQETQAEVTPVPDSPAGAVEKAKEAGDTVTAGALTKPGKAAGDENTSVNLAELAEKGPVVVIFYRGGWCGICMRQLREFDQAKADFEAAGATVVAVAGETPEAVRETVTKRKFGIDLLSDQGHAVGRQFGVVWQSARSAKRLTKTNGNDRGELNLGAAYILTAAEDGAEGELNVEWSFVEERYQRRATAEAVLEALKEL